MMKKMMLVGLIVISALSFAGKVSTSGSDGSMNQQQKEMKMTTQIKTQQRIYLEEKDRNNIKNKENANSLRFRKSMEKKYRANWDDIENEARMTTQTKTQQRIHLEERDRDNIKNKENANSLRFRKSMERKYRANWDDIEEAARKM